MIIVKRKEKNRIDRSPSLSYFKSCLKAQDCFGFEPYHKYKTI